MALTSFSHNGLAIVYRGGSSPSIPKSQERRCQRLLDQLDVATKPSDMALPGNFYSVANGVHSVVVSLSNQITFLWVNGLPRDIDYV